MSIFLSGMMACGGDIGTLMLFQVVLGCVGVYSFSLACLRGMYAKTLAPGAAKRLSVIVLAILVTPITPLMFYLAAFLKDAWLALAMLWIGVVAIRLHRRSGRLTTPGFVVEYGLFNILVSFATLVRHNAVVMLPAWCVLSWLIACRRWRKWAALAVVIPIVVFGVVHVSQRRFFRVKKTGLINAVMGLELVGLGIEDMNWVRDLPYTGANLYVPQCWNYYAWGNAGSLYGWGTPRIVTPAYALPSAPNEELAREYWRTVRNHPWAVFRVKAKGFFPHLGIHETRVFFGGAIAENDFGLAMNRRFAGVREGLVSAGRGVSRHRFLRWLSGVHIVWIGVNMLFIVWGVLRWRHSRRRSDLFWPVLMAAPLAYYAGYLAASTFWGFRFMYPSTLMIQVFAMSMLAGASFAKRRQAPHSRG